MFASKSSRHRPMLRNGKLITSFAIAAILILALPCIALAYPWKWEQGMMNSNTPGVNCNCEGIYARNTVQNDKCHAYCINKHANAIYVYDDYSIGQDQWAEMGWMWAKDWAHPRWYVDCMNAYGESFWLLGETQQGVDHGINVLNQITQKGSGLGNVTGHGILFWYFWLCLIMKGTTTIKVIQ